jgi:hypothetical protein
MTPQKSYSQWKQEQGLPVSGLDVTRGDTTSYTEGSPTEEALKLAVLLSRQLIKSMSDSSSAE